MTVWEEYQQYANNFQASLYQSWLVYSASKRLLKDYPNELPDKYKTSLAKYVEAYRIALDDMTKLLKDGKVTPSQEYKLYGRNDEGKYKGIALMLEDSDDYGEMVAATLNMLVPLNGLGVSINDIDFSNLSNSQQLITIYAFIESFISDSIRSICKQNPNVLKRKKMVEWDAVISTGSYDDLIN
ncbi:MAG TPA: hypothetical protein DEP19_00900 [Anaerolineae bacterium]|nr:hypothetical protein [Anaerolineae bacterium]